MLDCAPAASETAEGQEQQRQPVTFHTLILFCGSIARGDAAQVNVTGANLLNNACLGRAAMAAAAVSTTVHSSNTVYPLYTS